MTIWDSFFSLALICFLVVIHPPGGSAQGFHKPDITQLDFSHLIKFNPLPTALLDPRLNYLEVSDSWLQKYGLNQNVKEKGLFKSLLNKDNHADQLKAIDLVLSGETVIGESGTFLQPNGEVAHFKWRMCPWVTKFGKVGGLVIYDEYNEINTSSKVEELWSGASQLDRIGAWEMDLASEKVYMSSSIAQILEMPEKSLVLARFLVSRYRKEHQSILLEAFEKAKNDRQPFDLELALTTYKENEVWVRVTGHPVALGDKVVKVQGLFQDIDTSKRALLEAVERRTNIGGLNSQIDRFIENMPCIAFTMERSPSGKIDFLEINKRCEEFTGYSSEELKAKSGIKFQRLTLKEDRGRVDQVFNDYKDKEVFEVRYRIRTKGKRIKWCLATGKVISSGEDKRGMRVEGMIFDITQTVSNEARMVKATILGADNERRRIAEDLHDGVQQTLTTSQILFESLSGSIGALPENSQRKFLDAYQLLCQGINETREIAHTIMPKSVKDFGLVAAIKSLIYQLMSTQNIKINFYENLGGLTLQKHAEMHLFRILQGAVTNVIRHSRASELNIQLIRTKRHLSLIIEDNGIGFKHEPSNDNVNSVGLYIMKNRIGLLNGTIDISSTPGSGTSVVMEIPLNKNKLKL